MNTSHLSQNMSEIQALDAKTGENLNRLGKISEKLKNIHSNITSEKYSRYAEVEARLSALADKSEESQNEILKNFESTKFVNFDILVIDIFALLLLILLFSVLFIISLFSLSI